MKSKKVRPTKTDKVKKRKTKAYLTVKNDELVSIFYFDISIPENSVNVKANAKHE